MPESDEKQLTSCVPLDKIVSYRKADVEQVCKALLEDEFCWNSGDYENDYYDCNYCEGKTRDWATEQDAKNMKHELDCPVLVVRDLLTGS